MHMRPPTTFPYHTTPFTWILFTTCVVGSGIKFPQRSSHIHVLSVLCSLQHFVHSQSEKTNRNQGENFSFDISIAFYVKHTSHMP